MDAARIIFLHGASSSGKSTLARGLQAAVGSPFWHVSIDHLRHGGVLPMDRIRRGEFAWSEMRARVFDGFHRSLEAYARAGNDLILEHILDTDGWFEDLVHRFASFDVFFVAVRCSLAELTRRERERGDRVAGSAADDFRRIHRGLSYDFEVDAEQPVERNVEALLSAWRRRSRPSAFELLRTPRPPGSRWP